MGGKNSKGIDGGMNIAIEQRSCQPGDMIIGIINVMLNEALPPCTLILQFKGKEETYWTVQRSSTDSDGNSSTTTDVYKGKQPIINFQFPLYQWNSILSPGCFSFPFNMKLPDQLPGSFKYKNLEAKASIEYYVKAKFILPDKKKFKDKTEVHIYNRLISFQMNINLEKTSKIVCFYCCDKGSCTIKSKFSQDAFTPDQVAGAIIQVDNKNGQADIKNIAFTLWRSVRLKTNAGISTFYREKIIEDNSRGLLSGESMEESNSIVCNLNLPSVKNKLDMIYSTRGYLIECCYALDCHAELDGCCFCGGEKPSIEMPMALYSIYTPPQNIVQPPPGWNPVSYDQATLSYDKAYDIKPSS
ncbi:unnamed protein product [Blepharisma stoltei]|uniref:Arrestin-like N-terminal domain-containing protein n=1 Tax=Blepharisma stoltei TaxID=1481888 RepID=A0AAU9J4E8_9CILI|nr:unnamed protein product [Blepharisma stoltei]